MTPTLGRTARVADALMDQSLALAAWLVTVPPEQLERPSVVPGRQVCDVVEHMTCVVGGLQTALVQPSTMRPISLLAYACSLRNEHNLPKTLLVGTDAPAHLALQFTTVVDEVCMLLRRDAPPDTVHTAHGPVRVIDVLRIACYRMACTCDDLARSLPEPPGPALVRSTLAESTRVITDLLGTQYPGQSIEVRVPPFAAVQISDGSGPTHTRGTPPSVVEMEPLTLIRLAAGRITFAEAVGSFAVSASGAHCDLSAMFPVLSA